MDSLKLDQAPRLLFLFFFQHITLFYISLFLNQEWQEYIMLSKQVVLSSNPASLYFLFKKLKIPHVPHSSRGSQAHT